MNGPHDMGGQHAGPVQIEPNEPLFHADWERRAMALTVAMGACGAWNIDQSRAQRESLPPATYLGSSYYEIWIRALERLLLQRGLVGADELASGQALQAALPVARVLRREAVDRALAAGSPSERPLQGPPRFQVGQRVRTLNMHPSGHTRLPRYARGLVGVVCRIHGGHLFADRQAEAVAQPEVHWLYNLAFPAQALWGPAADPSVEVNLDAWEPYLAPLEEGAP